MKIRCTRCDDPDPTTEYGGEQVCQPCADYWTHMSAPPQAGELQPDPKEATGWPA